MAIKLIFTYQLSPEVTATSFRGKPSKSHIIWVRETRDGAETKRFDREQFRKWTKHCGFDFDKTTRVDHERSSEPREQYRCVFNWTTTAGESLELDGEEWELGGQKTPRTFVEIDTDGEARIKGWSFETVFNITEMKHKGPELLIKAADGTKKRLNGRKFVTDPRKQQREDTSRS